MELDEKKTVLIFATNARFENGRDGNTYGVNTSITRETFNHYLESFDHVKVLARVSYNSAIKSTHKTPVNDDKVSFLKLPYFIGPSQYLKLRKQVNTKIAEHLKDKDTLIARVPGLVGRLAANQFKKANKPYAVEVAGDPWDLFSSVASQHPLRWILRIQGYCSLKSTVFHSSAALYVTREYLQRRYPTQKGVFSTHASNVIIKERDIKAKHKEWKPLHIYNLLTVGTLDQLYKSPDETIELVKSINAKKLDFKICLKWIGGGKHLGRLRKKITDLNLEDEVEFLGKLNGRDLMKSKYEMSDLFLLLSKTEGLPRAVIEAMSFGLPVVATNAGGIKELLDLTVVFEHSNLELLQNRLVSLLKNDNEYNEQAQKNLKKAKEFTQTELNARRWEFYKQIIEQSKELVLSRR